MLPRRPGPPSALAGPPSGPDSRVPGRERASRASRARPAAEPRAQGVAAPGAALHRGAGGAGGLGALTHEPGRLRRARETGARPPPNRLPATAARPALTSHAPGAPAAVRPCTRFLRARTRAPRSRTHAGRAGGRAGGHALPSHTRAQDPPPRPQPNALPPQRPASAAAGFA